MQYRSIKISNVTTPKSYRAQAIVAALQGKSYMDLRVAFAPVGGSFDVLVGSERAESEADLRNMVIGVLISALEQKSGERKLREAMINIMVVLPDDEAAAIEMSTPQDHIERYRSIRAEIEDAGLVCVNGLPTWREKDEG